MDIQILVTDDTLTPVGDPIDVWDQLDVTLRFNEPASGSVVVPLSDDLAAQLAPSNRIAVIRDGSIFCAGPIEKAGPQQWAVTGQDAGPGTVRIAWTDDLALVCGRLTYPDPANAATAQTAARRTFTPAVDAEHILRSLVDENAGPSALAARQVPQLTLAADTNLGSLIKFSTRFEPLGDALRSVAIQGGGLGFRTTQDGTDIVFEVYDPQDLTGSVRFSRALGNLRSYVYDPEAPRVTAAIVGDGTGSGTSRVFRERTDAAAIASWWRLETLVDRRDTTDTDELDQAGDEALADGAETARLAAVTVDTDDQAYGTHYDLGDQVSVELNDGVEVADVVRAVHLQASPRAGELVTAIVGSQAATSDEQTVRLLRHLAQRLARLEAI